MAGPTTASGSHNQINLESIMNCPKCNKPAASPQIPRQQILGAQATAGACVAPAAVSKAWAAAAASAPGLLARIKNIVLSPKSEWQLIAPEPMTVPQLYVGYVMPLALPAALGGFLRMSVLGANSAFGNSLRMPISGGLTYTVMMYVS